MLGKHTALGKATKALIEKVPDDKSSSDDEEQRKRKKTKRSSSYTGSTRPPSSSGGSSKAPCFLCGMRGHRSSECRVLRDRWVSLETLPAELQNSAKAVRYMIKKETDGR